MLVQSGVEERPSSLNLLPTGNSSTLASVVLREGGAAAEAEVPSLAAAALPDFPGTDWLAAMSAMDAGNTSTLTSLAPPPPRAPLGFSYQVSLRCCSSCAHTLSVCEQPECL